MTLLPVPVFCSLLLSGAVQALELDSLEIKMINIMDRMTKMEADMEYKDQRIVALENSRQEMMSAMDSKDFTISALTDALEERDVAMSQLEKVKGLTSESSYFYECGWREEWSVDNENVTYEKLLYSSNSGLDGGLNITTGVFTAGTSGTWTISYSTTSVQYSGDIIQAFLYLNGQQYWASYFESSGRVSSLGSRSLHLHLNAGDTVTLGTGDQGHYGEFSGLWYITLCVELKQQDTT